MIVSKENCRVRICLTLAAAMVLGWTARAAELTLAKQGKTDYVIARSDKAIPAEKHAAEDLSLYLKKITGATFPIVSEADAKGKNAIYVGATDFAAQAGIKPDSLDKEAWVIRTSGKNLILSGGRQRGTLYAVYVLLEKHFGCHWLDELTEIVPNNPDLTLKELSVQGKPAFQLRMLYTGNREHKEVQLLRVRNMDTRTLGAGLGFIEGGPGHTFYFYSRQFPADHPEYHAMNLNGKRPPATSTSGPGQICLTNPEVRKLMVKLVEKNILSRRKQAESLKDKGFVPSRIFYVTPNDTAWNCQCPTCKAFTEKEGTDSALMVDFINSIADGIKDKYPDVLIGFFAYENNLIPPKRIRPRDNTQVCIAQLNAEWGKKPTFPDLYRPMNSPVNREAREIVLQWSKIAKHMEIWDYWGQYVKNKYSFPNSFVHCLAPDLKLFHDCGVERFFCECDAVQSKTSFLALTMWLGRQLLEDPDQDPAPLIRTFMKGYYGPAADKMTEYLNYMQKRIEEVPAKDGKLCAMTVSDRPYLDLAFFQTADRLLDEAEKCCPEGSLYLSNVRLERIIVDSGIYCLWQKLQKQLPKGQKMPWNPTNILQRYKNYRIADLKRRPFAISQSLSGKDAEPERIVEKSVASMKGFHAARTGMKLVVMTLPKLAEVKTPGDPAAVDWSKAADMGQWYAQNGSRIPERKISGKAVLDGKFLYLQLEEKDLDVAKLRPQWWSGDGWELFFSASRSGFPYHQLAVNPKGEVYAFSYRDSLIDAKKWDCGAAVKSERKDGCWRVRIALPLSSLLSKEAIAANSPIFVNIFRTSPWLNGRIMCLSPIFEAGLHDMLRLAEWIPETPWPKPEDNLIFGKSYKSNKAPNWKLCLNKDPKLEQQKLIDGKFAKGSSPMWFDRQTTAGFAMHGKLELTFDLERTAEIEKVLVHSGAGISGVAFPKSIEVLTGMDGEKFTSAGKLVPEVLSNAGYRAAALNIPIRKTEARYVKIVFDIRNWFFCLDEIAVQGKWK